MQETYLEKPIRESRSNTRNHVFNLVFKLSFLTKEELENKQNILDILNNYYETLESEIAFEKRKNEDFIPLKINKKTINKQILDIYSKIDEIDEKISKNLKNWTIERINKVDLAILRLITYEIIFEDLPLKVAINEAVELSKEYSDKNAYIFINGILKNI